MCQKRPQDIGWKAYAAAVMAAGDDILGATIVDAQEFVIGDPN